MKSREPFGRWLIRQAIAGAVLIVFMAYVLPDLLNAYFLSALEEIRRP